MSWDPDSVFWNEAVAVGCDAYAIPIPIGQIHIILSLSLNLIPSEDPRKGSPALFSSLLLSHPPLITPPRRRVRPILILILYEYNSTYGITYVMYEQKQAPRPNICNAEKNRLLQLPAPNSNLQRKKAIYFQTPSPLSVIVL